MKTTSTALLMALALGASAWNNQAQDQDRPERPGRRPDSQPSEGRAGERPPGDVQRPPRGEGGQPSDRGPGGERPRMPLPPIMAALDANGDGVIDEKEIANAAAALRKLDKNGDDKLTPDEIFPPRPEGGRGTGRPGFSPEGRRPDGQGRPEAGAEGRRRPEGAPGRDLAPEGRRPGGQDNPDVAPEGRRRPRNPDDAGPAPEGRRRPDNGAPDGGERPGRPQRPPPEQ